ncbi:hypothetical protein [Halorussus ruber]|uniref:hypothetical protein n=1 Tax=Halorussus ruber TaxID=1126238 RepID=UPI001091C2D6|nr:hypothetical protein [Halorussus ruber]
MTDVGGINRDDPLDSDADCKWAVVAHGFDDSPAYEAGHDEINSQEGKNRWHVQGHFEKEPYNDYHDTRGSQSPDFANFSMFNPKEANYTNFKNWVPDDEGIEDNYGYEFSASISVPITPFFSLSTSEVLNETSGGYVKQTDYEKLKYHYNLKNGKELPDSEDNAQGARFDVTTIGDVDETYPVNIYSKFGYIEYYGPSAEAKETDVTSFQARYKVI